MLGISRALSLVRFTTDKIFVPKYALNGFMVLIKDYT